MYKSATARNSTSLKIPLDAHRPPRPPQAVKEPAGGSGIPLILLAGNRHEERAAFARRQLDLEACAILFDLRGRRIETDDGTTEDAVETVIQVGDAVPIGRDFDLGGRPSGFLSLSE